MKEDLDKEVQGEEVEPNQGWSLVLRSTYAFFVRKILKKIHDKQKDEVYGN